jgi:hypothetical protein
MATSKPEFQGLVLTNGSGEYCALYKRKVINTSSSIAIQYYWLPTNKSGDITDFRVNILNGIFADAETANSNYPSGYSLYADTWPSEKTLSYMYNFPFDGGDLNVFRQAIDEWVELGVNNLLIPVFWHDVFITYAAQTDNASGSWTKQDEVITYAKFKGIKVSLMIHLYLSANFIPDFWGTANNEKDIFGDYIFMSGYGNGHPSLAGSGANMMKDFYQKVVARYSVILGNQLNWVTPVITEQSEYGLNYDNSAGGLDHKTLYGYSNDSINGFRTWLQTSAVNPDYYTNIAALNAAWGTSFGSFSVVTPPATGYGVGANEYQLSEVFASNQGKDFWKYLAYGQLTKFAADLRVITNTYAPQAKFILSFGSNAPNDPLSGLRGAYDVLKWSEVSDGLKTSFGADQRNSTMALTLDFMQNYTGKKMAELHHIDYYSHGSLSVSSVKANMIASGEAAMRNGVKDLLFIGMTKHGIWFDMLKDIMRDLRPKMAQNYDSSRQTGGRSTSVSLGELLSSPGGKVGLDKWIGAGGSNENRISYTFYNSIEQGTNLLPYSLSLFDNQTYYLKQLDIKNAVYGRTETETGPYNALQQSYNASRVPFLLSAFGITYTSGTKTRSTIEIIDNNGVVWVKSVQHAGVTSTEQGGKYANNHPEFRYMPNITEDCRFWLPVPATGGYYDVKISVYDAPCRFDVYHADTNAPDGIAYNPDKAITNAGSTETIRINRNQMMQSNINHRVIKINNNKWS